MSSNMKKYIGLDIHKDATSIAVLNGVGKLVMGIHHRNQSSHCAGDQRRLKDPAGVNYFSLFEGG